MVVFAQIKLFDDVKISNNQIKNQNWIINEAICDLVIAILWMQRGVILNLKIVICNKDNTNSLYTIQFLESEEDFTAVNITHLGWTKQVSERTEL